VKDVEKVRAFVEAVRSTDDAPGPLKRLLNPGRLPSLRRLFRRTKS